MRFKHSLIGTLLSCALILGAAAQDPMETARKHFNAKEWQQAADAYRPLVAAHPDHGQAWFELAFSLHNLKQYPEAAKAYREADRLSFAPVRTQYNLACVYALMNQPDPAFEWLRKTAMSGFAGLPNLLQTDADLAGLRNDPRFADLMKLAQRAARPCASDPKFADFDFWIGEWEVKTQQGQPAGTNVIQKILDDCVIFENWTGANGYTGKAFHHYNPQAGTWLQWWVDNKGGFLKFSGEYREGALRYEGEQIDRQGRKHLQRGTFHNLEPGRVRQTGATSYDGGKTWSTTFDFIYTKKP